MGILKAQAALAADELALAADELEPDDAFEGELDDDEVVLAGVDDSLELFDSEDFDSVEVLDSEDALDSAEEPLRESVR